MVRGEAAWGGCDLLCVLPIIPQHKSIHQHFACIILQDFNRKLPFNCKLFIRWLYRWLLWFLLHSTCSVMWNDLVSQQLPDGGLGSDLHYLVWSDTSLIRLQPKTLCLVWLSSKRWCLVPVHTAIAHTISISDTGKAGNWKFLLQQLNTSLGREVPSCPSPHQAPLGRASQVPVCCLPAFLSPSLFLSFFQQGHGKNRFASPLHLHKSKRGK